MKSFKYEKIINKVIDKCQEESFRKYGYGISHFVLPELANARFALIAAFREAGYGKWALKKEAEVAREQTREQTAKSIADWIAFRAFHGGYAEPVQNVLSELSDLIKRNYGVEVGNDD